jgi:hypothetical protein
VSREEQQASELLGRYLTAANEIAKFMLDGAREGDEERIPFSAYKLLERGDEKLLAVVLEKLFDYILHLERRALDAHGPLMTAEESGYQDVKPQAWQLAAHDQILAAAAEGDYQLVGQLAVDGQIKSIIADDEPTDWHSILRMMLLVEQNNLVLLATECFHRLVESEKERG